MSFKEEGKRTTRGKGEGRNTKKIPAHLYASTRMKCEAIYMHSPEYPVSKMCKALGVYENQYYRWIRANERRKRRRQAEQELVDKDSASHYCISCDNNKILKCIQISIDKEDVEFGLAGVSYSL